MGLAWLAILSAGLLHACASGDGADADTGAGPDADGDADADLDGWPEGDGPREDSCDDCLWDADAEAEPGPLTYVFAAAELVPDRVCDLDGDGIPNNAIADLGEPSSTIAAMTINSLLEASADVEGGRTCVHYPWVDDLSGPSDEATVAIVYHGKDPEGEDDPEDDFSGVEPFLVESDSLDLCGEPRFFFPAGRIDHDEVRGEGGTFPFATEELTCRGAEILGTLGEGGATIEAVACAYLLVRELGAAESFEAAGNLSMLEVLTAGGAPFGFAGLPGLAPDVDLDGDGLERIILDADNRVLACVDGDRTEITGPECWRDERMADALSVTFHLSGVKAVFGGREPRWQCNVALDCQCECDDGLLGPCTADGGLPGYCACDAGSADSSLFDPA
jgi:hypothetical protein